MMREAVTVINKAVLFRWAVVPGIFMPVAVA